MGKSKLLHSQPNPGSIPGCGWWWWWWCCHQFRWLWLPKLRLIALHRIGYAFLLDLASAAITNQTHRTMSLSSWFRRRLLRENGQFTKASIPLQQSHHEKEEQFLGVTDRLIEFVKSFTFDTFKNFPLQGISLFPSLYFFISIQKHGSAFLLSFAWILGGLFNELEHFRFVSQLRFFFFCSDEEEAPRGDENLSDWQERHAVLVLSKVKVYFLLLM